MWAAAESKLDVLKTLLDNKATINPSQDEKEQKASSLQNLISIYFFINNFVYQGVGEGISALMWASENDAVDAAKMLIDYKADVNLQDAVSIYKNDSLCVSLIVLSY